MIRQFSLRALLLVIAASAIVSLTYCCLAPKPRIFQTAARKILHQTDKLPNGHVYWFKNNRGDVISALLIFGDHPIVLLPHVDGGLYVESDRIPVPQDGAVHIVSPTLRLVKCELELSDVIKGSADYSEWGLEIVEKIKQYRW